MAVTPTYGGDTTNYGLKKLDLADAADFGIVNANMDIVDSTLAAKVDAQAGKGLSSNDYTTAEKNKLAGIEAQANKTVIDNSLSSTSTTHALSAAMGKSLSDTIATKANSSDANNHGLYSCVSMSALPTSGGNMSFSVSGSGITVGDITIPTYAKGHIVSTGQGGQDATLYAIDYNGNLYVAFRNGTSWGSGTMYTPIVYQEVTKTLSWAAGIHGQNFGTYTKQGYKLCGVMPVALARASTTLFAFNHNPDNGNVYMTTNSTYDESNATEKLLLMWRKA